ncbi:hypothetical protein [Streptomyces camelliae]|uniref:Uncharacterized protein n=1 Tax=Streptomyces camelliae TaxID=3004093 RepID=A0ABY7P068_9ACTN|nr:hypothetical protein [Streptomyces sp. HUAS 2-6]WBO63817.1 hypothetical protein O1G22_13770 [Streptomyces sp. HUAS 2-6]
MVLKRLPGKKGTIMARQREQYGRFYEEDFGLSGLGGKLCSGKRPRPTPPAVLELAAEAVRDEEDHQLGRDVRLLLESPVPDEVISVVWPAVTGGNFDPGDHGIGARDWLRMVAEVSRVDVPDKTEAQQPGLPEGELRACVLAEIRSAEPALRSTLPLPRVVSTLRQIVDEADADLGFRLFLRVLKAYAVPVDQGQYDRLLSIGDRLAYPLAAVFEGLAVRWRPLDAGRRDFGTRFGLPFLAAMFHGGWDAWRYEGSGTPREHVGRLAHGDRGLGPGTQAAVLLQDVRRLAGSALSDDAVTALWRTAAHRWNAAEAFDADGRAWLREIAEVCTARLADVAPAYVPALPTLRSDLTEAVLREVRDIGPALDRSVTHHCRSAATEGIASVLEETVRSVDPDLGFRFLLHLLASYDVAVSETQYARYQEIGARFGFHEEYVAEQVSANTAHANDRAD